MILPKDVMGDFVEIPAQWESEVEKFVVFKIVDKISLDKADLIHAWIGRQWKKKPFGYTEDMFPRVGHDCFIEASTIDLDLLVGTPDKVIEYDTSSGWLVMAGDVPAILAFDQETLFRHQINLVKQMSTDEEVEIQKFLFGKWIPLPENLVQLIDPGKVAFRAYMRDYANSNEIVANFADFYHEPQSEEPA